MKTVITDLIEMEKAERGLDGWTAAAQANGMSLEQFAASKLIRSAAADPEARAILVNKETALPALSRVAQLPLIDETHEATTARIIAAIIG